MNSTKWIAIAAVTLTLTLAATHEAFADSGYATNCQAVADGATRRINTCWFHAGNDARERQVCNELQQAGQALVNWCNKNINRCKQNYVSWHIEGNSVVGVDWRAQCAYR